MLVESHNRYDDVGDFDHECGTLTQFSRCAPNKHRDLLNEHVRGHFAWLDGKLSVFYRNAGALWLSIDGQEVNVELPDIEVRCERADDHSRLVVLKRGVELAAAEYLQDPNSAFTEDLTPFVEPEDRDFGVFVLTVLDDPGRRRRIYQYRSA